VWGHERILSAGGSGRLGVGGFDRRRSQVVSGSLKYTARFARPFVRNATLDPELQFERNGPEARV